MQTKQTHSALHRHVNCCNCNDTFWQRLLHTKSQKVENHFFPKNLQITKKSKEYNIFAGSYRILSRTTLGLTAPRIGHSIGLDTGHEHKGSGHWTLDTGSSFSENFQISWWFHKFTWISNVHDCFGSLKHSAIKTMRHIRLPPTNSRSISRYHEHRDSTAALFYERSDVTHASRYRVRLLRLRLLRLCLFESFFVFSFNRLTVCRCVHSVSLRFVISFGIRHIAVCLGILQ